MIFCHLGKEKFPHLLNKKRPFNMFLKFFATNILHILTRLIRHEPKVKTVFPVIFLYFIVTVFSYKMMR